MSWLSSIFKRKQPALTTGRILTPKQLCDGVGYPVISSDAAYAEVSSQWLRSYYEDFREVLFREGVTGYDNRFDCDDFGLMYIGLANMRYYRAAWHSDSAAQSLALGEFWYITAAGQSHAVVVAFTERGRLFIEPQTGRELSLTPSEVVSAYLVKF